MKITILASALAVIAVIFAVPFSVGDTLHLNVGIQNINPFIEKKWEVVGGVEVTQDVIPTPGQNTVVRVCSSVCDNNTVTDISTVLGYVTFPGGSAQDVGLVKDNSAQAQSDCLISEADPDFVTKHGQEICDLWTNTFNIPATSPAGVYSIEVNVTDVGTATAGQTNALTISTCTAIDIPTPSLNFNNLVPGQISGEQNVTVTNVCNGAVDIEDDRPTLNKNGGGDTIPPASIIENLNAVGTIVDPEVGDCFDANLAAGADATLSTAIDVPIATLPGTYSGDKVLTAHPSSECGP